MPSQASYSPLDRLLHRIAFASPAIQLTAAEVETRLCAGDHRVVTGRRPIFITSLPRAGTTVLLQSLSTFPTLAAHTYRDMPFVMAPLLWSKLSASFRRQAELHERAHHDGMLVGYDTPEAFEEVLWKAFWPEKYGQDRIALWQGHDCKDAATAFFREHLRKIVALRRPGAAQDGRYLSKNNANIARLDLLGRMFDEAATVVPFRAPIPHAASLLRQHRNFLVRHERDRFARRYMADIGHFEFGLLHRPIDFPGLEALTAGRSPDCLDYWLGYWIAAFEAVQAQRESVYLLSYEDICASPRRSIAALCRALRIPHEGAALATAADAFRSAPPTDDAAGATADPALLTRARALHETLLSAAGSWPSPLSA